MCKIGLVSKKIGGMHSPHQKCILLQNLLQAWSILSIKLQGRHCCILKKDKLACHCLLQNSASRNTGLTQSGQTTLALSRSHHESQPVQSEGKHQTKHQTQHEGAIRTAGNQLIIRLQSRPNFCFYEPSSILLSTPQFITDTARQDKDTDKRWPAVADQQVVLVLLACNSIIDLHWLYEPRVVRPDQRLPDSCLGRRLTPQQR